MCEAKQSIRQLADPERFADTIKRLRPDIGTIAIMEPETPAIRESFGKFQSALDGSGVRAELLTLLPSDLETEPRLNVA